ncbi:MAG: gamma-glutamyltransferase family protein [Alphaproteobacteria bacterium]
MLHSAFATRGMVTAPHHLAAEAGRDVLRDGGNAIEAMVAAAAAIAVVYPHMNAIGGDGFWLISRAGAAPVGIDACGPAAAAATPDLYRAAGHAAIPARGPLAALTVAGTIGGWIVALDLARQWGGRLPLPRLLEPAIGHARDGFGATPSQVANTAARENECRAVPGFADTFLPGGVPPAIGDRFALPALGATLERLAAAGLDDFYRGDVAAALSADLAAVGSPVARGDLAGFRARAVAPLSTAIRAGTLYNMPPPTQGLASLLILAQFDRLACAAADGFDHVHLLIEATKQAFRVRDRHVTDPAFMDIDPAALLAPDCVAAMAAAIDPATAAGWARGEDKGDTIWMGAIDGAGNAVSFIQSVYWEFGSGVVLPHTGVVWQNRGASFSLDPAARNPLVPGRRPFHTLNPALARLADGSTMVYGTMGGEGQPQTQAAVFTRHVMFGQGLQAAITAPRWLLGRTWGSESTTLKIEPRFAPGVIEALAKAGHEIEITAPFSETLGHAGALVRRPGGVIEGASDPRSDGRAAGF